MIAATDASLRLRIDSTPVDIVRYPYPLLEPAVAGPAGFPGAGLHDLAAMKLSAISRRGIRRDFWDLYAMIHMGGITLDGALESYLRRFGVSDSDVYHVLRSLAYFDDAEKEAVYPEGLDRKLWGVIKAYFQSAAAAALTTRVQRG